MTTAGDQLRRRSALRASLVAARISPSALHVAAEHRGTKDWGSLLLRAARQLEGSACIQCGSTRKPMAPVGIVSGYQVFACVGMCEALIRQSGSF
jgi:hypothetical protein